MSASTSADRAIKPIFAEGFGQGITAYLIWGLLPLVIRQLANIDPFAIVAWRILLTLIALVAVMAARGMLKSFGALLGSRGAWPLVASGSTIAINWFIYIWAVNSGHILATSLGYFLNPLISVLLGRLILKERLNRVQMLAIAIAAAAVVLLAIGAGRTLWISLILAFSFALYGLIRKMAAAPPMQGLAAESLFLLPVGGAILAVQAMHGSIAMLEGPGTAAMLVVLGMITMVPLLLFAAAARKLTLTTLGLLQYIAPTMQFLLGLFVFGETMTTTQLLCFTMIWTALAIFTVDAVRMHRALVPAGAEG